MIAFGLDVDTIWSIGGRTMNKLEDEGPAGDYPGT
jgi:hypothetical protein